MYLAPDPVIQTASVNDPLKCSSQLDGSIINVVDLAKKFSPDVPPSESDIVMISGSANDEGRIEVGFWPLPIASCNLSSRFTPFSSEPRPLSK